MRFRCFNGLCVCHRLDPITKTPGGIFLPDTAQKKSERVEILEVCPSWVKDGRERKTALKPGDIALISKYSGQEFEIATARGELTVVLVREDDILCVLEDCDGATVAPASPASESVAVGTFWGDGLPTSA